MKTLLIGLILSFNLFAQDKEYNRYEDDNTNDGFYIGQDNREEFEGAIKSSQLNDLEVVAIPFSRFFNHQIIIFNDSDKITHYIINDVDMNNSENTKIVNSKNVKLSSVKLTKKHDFKKNINKTKKQLNKMNVRCIDTIMDKITKLYHDSESNPLGVYSKSQERIEMVGRIPNSPNYDEIIYLKLNNLHYESNPLFKQTIIYVLYFDLKNNKKCQIDDYFSTEFSTMVVK
ncbi:hypothetical protein N9N67_05055 [Bacteriovoracaceae bacterium]|nr:hypothetical protein [Bacteriovoracaceae bacterium]